MQAVRSPWFDNAKAILMVLVVLGHLIEEAARQGGLNAGVYGAIYLFHMPAFALISGMLTRAVPQRVAVDATRRLIYPLVVFQALYWPVLNHFAPHRLGDLLTPHWILWFLVSLAIWRVALPIFQQLRFPVLSAIAIAVAAGFVDSIGYGLSLSRTLVFFPAFLFGHLYGRRVVEHVRAVKVSSNLVFGGLVVLAVWVFWGQRDFDMLYGSLPYSHISEQPVGAALARLLLICVGIAISVLFLAICPTKESGLTRIGKQTLIVYLVHGFVVVLVWRLQTHETVDNAALFLGLNLACAVILTALLARAGEIGFNRPLESWKHVFHRSRLRNDP